VDSDVRLPQNIAHRGFNGQYPENTILAIEKGIEVGAHAIEIDLHISRDGVVVLSHVSPYPCIPGLRSFIQGPKPRTMLWRQKERRRL
jgi:hypothetical protein